MRPWRQLANVNGEEYGYIIFHRMTKLLIRSCEGLKESQELYLGSENLLTSGKRKDLFSCIFSLYYVLWVLLIAA